MLILRKSNCINTASGIVTLFRLQFSTQVKRGLLLTCVLNSYLKRVTIPDAVLIQFDLLRISIIVLETCRGIQ